MSSSIVLQDLTLLTRELMIKEGIDEYDLHIEGYSKKGENYLGDVTFFKVVPKEDKKEYNLVMKTAKRSEELRETMPVGIAYRRESYMYQQVFPEMRKFLKSTGDVVQFDYVPKIYSFCDEDKRETLILENLSKLGYRVLDRKKTMDLEHVLLVLKTLGKHHAVSLAMREKIPIIFEEKTERLSNVFIDMMASIDANAFYLPLVENACELLEKSGKEDLAKKVREKIRDNILSILLSQTPVEDRMVICHGDCWNNNIMFKYKESEDSSPSAICFVDFQISMLDSPIKDLSYFIYSACDKAVLENFDLLLQTYYASLSTTSKLLGVSAEKYFTYETLLDQWNEYGRYGLIMSTMIVKAELLNTEEAPDITEMAESGTDPAEAFSMKMENEELYNDRILDIFIHFAEKFL